MACFFSSNLNLFYVFERQKDKEVPITGTLPQIVLWARIESELKTSPGHLICFSHACVRNRAPTAAQAADIPLAS